MIRNLYNRLRKKRKGNTTSTNTLLPTGKEQVCLNCGTPLKGMYCHRCGQYALDIHQPMWKYVRQYFENMYQFDGKIWRTIRLMFARPGFLTNEFNAGKINSYVHPFRLYMCLSVVFFTVFFMVAEQQTGKALLMMNGQRIPTSVVDNLKSGRQYPDTTIYAYNSQLLIDVLQAKGVEQAGSLVTQHYGNHINSFDKVSMSRLLFDSCMTRTALHEEERLLFASLPKIRKTLEKSGTDSRVWDDFYDNSGMDIDSYLVPDFLFNVPIDSTGRFAADVYDWMTVDLGERLQQQSTAAFVMGSLSKWTPFYLMFLLPVLALLFKAFYPRRRYMEHFAHATHLSSMFLILLPIPAGICLTHFNLGGHDILPVNTFQEIILNLFPLLMLVYQYISMHTVYREGWGRTVVKCILVYGLFLLFASAVAIVLIVWLVMKVMGVI